MELHGKLKDISFDFATRKPIISFLVNENINSVEDIQDKNLTITAKETKKRRSLDANAYAWALIGQIADKLRISKEECYLHMLKHYGQSSMVSVVANIDVKGYFKYYERGRTSEITW